MEETLLQLYHAELERVVASTTQSEGAQERLMSKPIDILCFGRAGVGKTALLEALSGRHLGSTPKLDHGTTKLGCCEVHEMLPKRGGGMAEVHIRFWDTMGIESWKTTDDIRGLFQELGQQQVDPLCVFYCASGIGRVSQELVASILKAFIAQKKTVFYVITNVYSLSNEQLQGQLDGANEVMVKATGQQGSGYPNKKFVTQYTPTAFVVGVNSKKFQSALAEAEPLNVDTIMQLCVSTLNEEQLTEFFLATLKNRNMWEFMQDSLKTIRRRLENQGIDISSFLQNAWKKAKAFIDNLLA